MNAVVTVPRDWTSDTHGSGYTGVLRVVGERTDEPTSTLAGDYAVSVIPEEEEDDARFAAELGRRAWRHRAQSE